MKKGIHYFILVFLLLGVVVFSQEKKLNPVDGQQKENLYSKYKKEVQLKKRVLS